MPSMDLTWVLVLTLAIVDLLLDSVHGQHVERKSRPPYCHRCRTQGRKRNISPLRRPQSMIQILTGSTSYTRQDPPVPDRPTRVSLGIYINSFYSISEQTMDYSISFYLRQRWRDPRLAFIPMDKNVIKVKLADGEWNNIWRPDVFFRNEKSAQFHSVTTPNRLLQLSANGEVWYVMKISATLSCSMKLQRYPLDTQECPIMFESFGYTMDTMYFAWLDDPVDIEPGLQLPQFELIGTERIDCSQNYTAGAFPCLQINFKLKRDIGYFLIQVYVPTMLIVILSWVAFWINIDAIPARVSLGLLTVLTMTTQSSGARSTLPRVSYIKAIDVWMSMCLIFVFASLLEFAVVNVISRKEVRTIKPVRRPASNLQKELDPEAQVRLPVLNIMENGMDLREPPKRVDPEGKTKARRIDKVSRKVFPLAFLVFNIIYWIHYTCLITEDEGKSPGS